MSSEEERAGLPENLTKKILTLGLGAYFLTEDTVRRYVKDAKIPRDIARSITQNASKGKEELYGYVARELSSFLRQMDLQQELDRFVRTHKIRVSAEIEFLPRPGQTELTDDDSISGSQETLPSSEDSVELNVSFKAPQRRATPSSSERPAVDDASGDAPADWSQEDSV